MHTIYAYNVIYLLLDFCSIFIYYLLIHILIYVVFFYVYVTTLFSESFAKLPLLFNMENQLKPPVPGHI